MAQVGSSLFDHPKAPLAVFAGAFMLFLWQKAGAFAPAFALMLPDTDDTMRLVQVRDWLAGQSWFDTRQYRYLDGASMHWSRLIDAPLAASIMLLSPLFGPMQAQAMTAAFWPPLLFAALLALTGWGTGRLFGRASACYAMIAALLSLPITSFAMPGRIDHHNVQMLLVLGASLALMLKGRDGVVGSAALGAFSLAIGFETLPLVAVLGVFLALRWVWMGEEVREMAVFACLLFAFSLMLFVLQTGKLPWQSSECDVLGAPAFVLLGASALAAIGLVQLSACAMFKDRMWRLLAALAAGAMVVVCFALVFPSCLSGPYSQLPERVRAEWLSQVFEAMSLSAALTAQSETTLSVIGPLVAAIFVLAFGARRHPVLLLPLLMMLAGFALSFVQIRAAYLASVFVPLAVGWALPEVLHLLSQNRSIAFKAFALAGTLALFAPGWFLPWRAYAALTHPQTERPARLGVKVQDFEALNTLPPGMILAPIDLGPNLLLHSPHKIIAGPYHRNVRGLEAAIEGLDGDEKALRRVMQEYRADYLVLPPDLAMQNPESFAVRLARNEVSASWLEPVHRPGLLKIWHAR